MIEKVMQVKYLGFTLEIIKNYYLKYKLHKFQFLGGH